MAKTIKVGPQEVSKDAAREMWTVFFRCQRHPILRSQLIVALIAGQQLTVARVPTALLLDLFVMATAAREFHDAEIVDSYDELVTVVKEIWNSPEYTAARMDQQHSNLASSILFLDSEVKSIFERPEDRYVPALVAAYLEMEAVPVYMTPRKKAA